jgi:hypothetical protein
VVEELFEEGSAMLSERFVLWRSSLLAKIDGLISMLGIGDRFVRWVLLSGAFLPSCVVVFDTIHNGWFGCPSFDKQLFWFLVFWRNAFLCEMQVRYEIPTLQNV